MRVDAGRLSRWMGIAGRASCGCCLLYTSIESVAVEAVCRAKQETRKNLLKPPGDATVSGVTYTLQDNGTYLANGTVAGTGLLSLYKGVLPAGQYTISGGAGGIQVSLAVYKARCV